MAVGGLLVIVGLLGLIFSVIMIVFLKSKKKETKKANNFLGIFSIVFLVGVGLCIVLDNNTSTNVNSASDSTSSIPKKDNLSFKLKDDENMIDSDLNGVAVISGTAKPNTQINLVPDDDAKKDGFKRVNTKSDDDGNFKFTVNVNEKQIVEVFHLKAIDHKKKEVTIFSEVKSSTEESTFDSEFEEESSVPTEVNIADYNTGITYDNLARNPEDNEGKKVTLSGEIVQVVEGDDYTQYRLAVGQDYDNMVLIEISSEQLTSRVLENDLVTIYGESRGVTDYESTLGGQITIPAVTVDKYEITGKAE